MSNQPSGKCILIQPGAYPVLAAAGISKQLRDPKVAQAAECALDGGASAIRGAALVYIDRLQTHINRMQAAVATSDFDLIYGDAHEVRGLAGNAGLTAAARIAGELCRYLDAMGRANATPDATLVQLHLKAVVRAARAEDETTRLGSTVAEVLATLVNKKLAEINAS
jgi:HPt (histidine-containing phosphotransfer) domain-containing protein